MIGLVIAGRRGDARAFAGFVPDCVIFFGRLVCDPRVSRRQRALLLALGGYLAMPFDLVPDFIPVAGQLDDAIIVMLVLRRLLRPGVPDLIHEHWPGPPESRRLLLRLAGIKSAA
ncbi:MAG: DUF1232 domain-containing protein [Actinomycetota bacterium]|nr:DUF1232 domain-containing protein [Actinomycetota bacterium]